MTQMTHTMVYLYGLAPLKEIEHSPALPKLSGIDSHYSIHLKKYKDIAAFICLIEKDEYSEEAIDKKVQDLKWLQEKAVHHHEVLETLQRQYTVIPLKFCTLFNDEQGLEESVNSSYSKIISLFSFLSNKEEWNLKIYCDEAKLKHYVSAYHPSILQEKEALKKMPRGRQYLKGKLLEKTIVTKAEEEKNRLVSSIHHQIQPLSIQHHIKDNLGRDITGRNAEMIFNGVYLIDHDKVRNFKEQVESLQKSHEEFNLSLEYSGPWPVYHFSSIN